MICHHGLRRLVLVFLMIQRLTSVKILHFVPTLSYSHVAFNGHLADLLSSKGHNVTVMLINVDPSVSDSAIKRASVFRVDANVTYNELPTALWHNPGPFDDASPLNPKIVRKLINVAHIFGKTCKHLIANSNLISAFESEHFDIGVVEQYDMCGVGFFRLIGIKRIIWLSATAIYRIQPETAGVNYPLSYVPELFSPFSDRMTFVQRLLNLGIATVTESLHKMLSISEENKAFRKLMRNKNFNLFEEASQSRLIVSNTQPFLDFPAPKANNFISIGGLSVPAQRISKLSRPWIKIANKSPFIIVTFGSIAKTIEMPSAIRTSLFKAFQKFSQFTFIVKYETNATEIRQFSGNVYLASWLPQMDLISHHNYNGIVTHGGWSTVIESLSYGKPMILMPLFADHFKNAMVLKKQRLGIIIDKTCVYDDTFSDALYQLIFNPQYAHNSAKFAQMLHEALPTDMSRLIEYCIKRALWPLDFTDRHFRLQSVQHTLWHNNSLDILMLLCLIVIIVSL